ncbi:DUF4232 domain-containing protein [Streptomyces sp. sk2.1]|uniref:DUF4232 domain-containing protein n=1 Tax=Streptomyces sp. sk2.1 TaxID=2478959 RepID=UPI0011E8377B|nr:DUF4232 domain-containing protein [Streptomyces sp. sk2.1]TXS69268.1 DUF4232 domain-containing protein [Streptomyces sp. sk2.1]
MRTSIRRPAVLAATAVAALGLTLTACGGGEGTKDNGAATSAATVAATVAASADGGTSGSATAASGASGSGASGVVTTTRIGVKKKAPAKTPSKSSSNAAPKARAKTPACTVGDVKISAAKQPGVPTTHITLTATNVSGRSCTLLQYPLLAFGELPQTSKDVPPVAKSRPGTPIVLNADTPAYAAVRINNGGVDEKTHTVRSFYVNLFAADGPAEGSETVIAPKGGIAVDDAVAKTGYWTYELRNGADEF